MKADELHYATLLHGVGLKSTGSRAQILSVLSRAKTPMRIKDIAAILSKTHADIDTVTIYRTMQMFSRLEMVRRVDFGEDAAYYELNDIDKDYHYISCLRCKRRESIDHCFYKGNKARIKAQAPQFSTITHHSLVFFGICKKCAGKKVSRK